MTRREIVSIVETDGNHINFRLSRTNEPRYKRGTFTPALMATIAWSHNRAAFYDEQRVDEQVESASFMEKANAP